MRIGVHTLPKFQRDATDRNRTSPFAFTGNKFEFRMLGSADSISCTNTVLNTIVAEELKQFADTLEGVEDFEGAMGRGSGEKSPSQPECHPGCPGPYAGQEECGPVCVPQGVQ